MKRVYARADSRAEGDGFAVTLDDRVARTPGGHALILPTAALAAALAAEWEAQGETIERAAMPLNALAASVLDVLRRDRAPTLREIAGYGETDLVCHRAARPEALVARQAAAWDPLLDWLAAETGARLAVAPGVLPIAQPPEALAALRARIEAFDDFALAALHAMTTACGSLVIALALAAGRLDARAAFAASRVDEDFQAESWGEDADGRARADRLAAEIAAAARFLTLSRT